MNGDPGQDGLLQGMSSMLALESRLDERLSRLSAETSGYLEAPTVISELHSLVREQREALQAHLEGLGDTDVPPVEAGISAAFEAPSETQPGEQAQGTLATMRAVATAFTETAFGYEALHGLAHRFFHVPTADLADQHRRNYLQAAQAVHRAAGDVVIQELQEAGHACRCECPACGPGICLCWHVHLESDTQGPGLSGEGFVVRAPRAGSNAEQAGLRHGDVILAVESGGQLLSGDGGEDAGAPAGGTRRATDSAGYRRPAEAGRNTLARARQPSSNVAPTHPSYNRRRPMGGATMTKIINCECGYVARGETEDEVVVQIQDHMREDHPDVLEKVSREDLVGWIEET